MLNTIELKRGILKYPDNKDLLFDKIEKELQEFDNSEEARKQDKILR